MVGGLLFSSDFKTFQSVSFKILNLDSWPYKSFFSQILCGDHHFVRNMDLRTRIEIVELYFSNGSSSTAALRAYKTAHNLRRDPFATTTITRLVSRFRETGSVADKPRSGRPSEEEERTPIVQTELERLQNSHDFAVASSYSVSHGTGIPQSSVQRILRGGLGLYPYRLQTNQALSERDKEKRMRFAQLMLSDEIDLESVLWTDESYFSLTGLVTRHNSIIWGSQRPEQSMSTTMHDIKVCVWFGYSARYRLTPYFFPATVTGENYTEMLRSHAIPEMRRKNQLEATTFQQDGAPPHFSRVARDFLSSVFPEERIIARGFSQNWPAYSPDLSPLDYYFWGTVKDRVYNCFRPTNIEELQQRICEVIANVDDDELKRSILHLPTRLQFVMDREGGAFEHLL